MDEYEPGLLPDLLPSYYKKAFPCELFYRWLDYEGGAFVKREFSFTLKNDVYIRYLSFVDHTDFEKELIQMCPHKIDIGAIFSHKPKDRDAVDSGSFKALEKELVFDIDISDYDDVRFCCQGADICHKCWPLMAMAVQIIDRALKEDFGYDSVLWVYSGRRGVHAWVADDLALCQEVRSAIVEYLTLIKGGDKCLKKVQLKSAKMHPSIRKSLQIIDKHLEDYFFSKQDFLSNEHKINALLPMLPDYLKEKFSDFIEAEETDGEVKSQTQWEVVKKLIEARRSEVIKQLSEKKPPKDARKHLKEAENLLSEIKLQYCYPRLDAHVSIGVNHLLKSPFSIHPKTGKVCVPFEASKAFDFDLNAVPTICDVLRDCKEFSSDKNNFNKAEMVPKCMRESIKIFKKFIEGNEKKFQNKENLVDF